MSFKSGFISILGRPNAGKSTLLNTLVGEKVSIVSWKPQTTRDKISGIINGDGYQAVFLDTPGIHYAKSKLSEYMMRSVQSSLENVDIVVYVVACDKPIDDTDKKYLSTLAAGKTPLLVALNKCDAVEKEEIVLKIQQLDKFKPKEILPISAVKGKNCDELKAEIIKLLPDGEAFFPEDMFTDKTLRFMCAEIIREKALKCLSDEIPYGVGVSIADFNERSDGIVEINADIIAEKKAHKGIIIGKNGAMLKKISTMAREDMEKLLQTKVYLRIWVKVKDQWRDDNSTLEELGYNKKDI